MATEMTTNDESPWTRARILARVDGTDDLSATQKRALVKMVRNPDTATTVIGESIGTDEAVASNTLRHVKVGGYDTDGIEYDPRLDEGTSDFLDLTLKQRASVDFHARYPNVYDALTMEEANDRCREETGVSMHYITLYQNKDDFSGAIRKRRAHLDRDEVVELDTGGKTDKRGTITPLRERLEQAGITTLPDHNLDGLPTQDEVVNTGRVKGAAAPSRDTDDTTDATEPDTDDAATADSGGDTVTTDTGDTTPDEHAADGRVEQQRGKRSYKGPSRGLDLAGDAEPSVLVDRDRSGETAEAALGEAFERARDEAGPFGEDAFKRTVSIDDKDALEAEIRRLRMIVSTQGSLLRAMHDALSNLTVDVSVGYDEPEDAAPGVDPEPGGGDGGS